MAQSTVIEPGSILGMIGGGQLALMTLYSAVHPEAYRMAVWAEEQNSPALRATSLGFNRPYDDEETFQRFLELGVRVVTNEWENVPVELLEKFEDAGIPVRPSPDIMRIASSRAREKEAAGSVKNHQGVTPVRWTELKQDVLQDDNKLDPFLPGIIKADSGGYDGQKQWSVETPEDVRRVLLSSPDVFCVLEKRLELQMEFSVAVARNLQGQVVVSQAVKNTHEAGILRVSEWYPEVISQDFEIRAQVFVVELAKMLGLEGLLVVEFFVDEHDDLYFNEMAPRPHNSFHASMEATNVSQYDLFIRAICNRELPSMGFRREFHMVNLLGSDLEENPRKNLLVGGKIHNYGKAHDPERPLRKRGHATRIFPVRPRRF